MNTGSSFTVYSIADGDLSFGQEYFVEDCEYGELIDYLLKRTGGIGSDVNGDGKFDIADYIALIY